MPRSPFITGAAVAALVALARVDTARAEDFEETPVPVVNTEASAERAPSKPIEDHPAPVSPIPRRIPGPDPEPQQHADVGEIVGGAALLTVGLFADVVGVAALGGAATHEEHQGGGGFDFDIDVSGLLVGIGAVGFAIGIPCTIGGIYLIADGAKGSTDSPNRAAAPGPTLRWQVTPTAAALQATF